MKWIVGLAVGLTLAVPAMQFETSLMNGAARALDAPSAANNSPVPAGLSHIVQPLLRLAHS